MLLIADLNPFTAIRLFVTIVPASEHLELRIISEKKMKKKKKEEEAG